MSSLLSDYKLRRLVLAPYLRTLPISPDEWSNVYSQGLRPGNLVFCLESTMSADTDSAIGLTKNYKDIFHVVEMAAIIEQQNHRSKVLLISPTEYKINYLDALLNKQTQGANQLDRDIHYLLVEPKHSLADTQINNLAQFEHVYSQGGFRDALHADNSSIMDPAIPLLTELGLNITPDLRQQVMDLGMLLFLILKTPPPNQSISVLKVNEILRAIPIDSNFSASKPTPLDEVITQEGAQPAYQPESQFPAIAEPTQVHLPKQESVAEIAPMIPPLPTLPATTQQKDAAEEPPIEPPSPSPEPVDLNITLAKSLDMNDTPNDIPPTTATVPTKISLQSPGPVTSAMEALIAKLDQQVSRAASNLSAQVNQIHDSLEHELKTLLQKAFETEKQDEFAILAVLETISKELDKTTEESRVRLSDIAAAGRYAIKRLLEQNQQFITERQSTFLSTLIEACKDRSQSSSNLAHNIDDTLNDLVLRQTTSINELVASLYAQLSETEHSQTNKLYKRYKHLQKRINNQSQTVDQSYERLIVSLTEDIADSFERAGEKLKLSQQEFELAIQQAVAMRELDLSMLVKSLSTTELVPRLREHQDNLKTSINKLHRRFEAECHEKIVKQNECLNAGVLEIKQQHQQVLSESLSELTSVGTEQQKILIETFTQVSDHVEHMSAKTNDFYQNIEVRIAQSENAGKELVELAATTTSAEVINAKQAAIESLKYSQYKSAEKLQAVIESTSLELTEISNREITKVTAKRERLTQFVHQETNHVIEQIREAIQEAFDAIQQCREQHLE